MAVHNYHATFGSLPPAIITGRDGKSLHSWRVLLLPYLGREDLYAAYHFDEPWDGPNNARLAGKIGNIFRRPEAEADGSLMTSFVAVVGPETAYPGRRALKFEEIGDGIAHTISFVEIADSDIPWMEPRDLPFDRMSFRVNDRRDGTNSIGSPYGGARIALLDGSVRSLRETISPGVLKALLTANGGEKVEDAEW